MLDITVRRANAVDRPVLERFWPLFQHDLSGFRGGLPDPDRSFRSEWLEAECTDADRVPYLVTSLERPVGFAFVCSLAGPIRVLNSFFVVRGARRVGIGSRAVREVVARHPGPWEVAFQDNNPPAVRFWRRVAAEIVGDAWLEERRPVSGRPDLPPDVWISFRPRIPGTRPQIPRSLMIFATWPVAFTL
ncbi:GNAT family N-acetyltransferase [Streptomyces albiflavescens]|uniref:GNAT family N-acetyltransferase n=1 Tax=Streptomyces albiflavescens TaxID=1623582 RepID=UPI001665DB25|nr:GNAT family N-acetyltransferase [Streptomyces albiflavescens]